MKLDNNQLAFFALLSAGLWEKDIQLLPYGKVDYKAIYKLSQEQSIVGLIAAGLEHIIDTKIPKDEALCFVGDSLQLEQRNAAMNSFIGILIEKLTKSDVFALLVKGQGIAQCYDRPLWRVSGDVDLLLDKDNYYKAKSCLVDLVTEIEDENVNTLHQGFFISPWEVELHGTFRTELWGRLDKGIDKIHKDTFEKQRVREWTVGEAIVYLPAPDYDILFVFVHILQHFFKGGIGLRQICDWCRLLWTYRTTIDLNYLERSLNDMGIISEWKAFSVLAVEYLGMPKEAMPLYDSSVRGKKKARIILSCILKTGNFGRNIDNSFRQEYGFLARKIIAVWKYLKEAMIHFVVFPIDSLKVCFSMMKLGTLSTFRDLSLNHSIVRPHCNVLHEGKE